jgi:hypothetical protein
MDAKQRFFDTMEKEMVDAIADSSRSEDHLGLDFSVTESGRTVAHMIGETSSGRNYSVGQLDGEDDDDEDMDMEFSVASSGQGHLMGLTEADQDEMVKSFANSNNNTNAKSRDATSNDAEHPGAPSRDSGKAPLYNTVSSARSIPVPAPNKNYPPLMQQHQQPQSQGSSQGSSGSAFLSSVLNPTGSTFAGNYMNSQQQHQLLSHTPPTALGTSYEASHFGKRARSGSISGRLRSASEYLEDKGLIDRETRGILKDLIIIGDEELQQAIDRYEGGDPSLLEEMISSGALQNRLPKDIDILGDLDLDFLTMDDGLHDGMDQVGSAGDIEPLQNGGEDLDSIITNSLNSARHAPSAAGLPSQARLPNNVNSKHHGQPNMVSPPYDDGIGELEFAGDFVSDQADFMQIPHQTFGSKQTSAAASPAEATLLNDFESRMRSNSLFSALLNDPRGSTTTAGADGQDAQYGQWMDSTSSSPGGGAKKKPGININKSNRRASAPVINSGLGASLEQYKGKSEKAEVVTKEEQKRRDKKEKKERKEMEKQDRKDKKEQAKKKAAEEEMVVHEPGSGRPRSLSDPNLSSTVDQFGLMQVDRPDGWVGAYSPESRTVRIERFMAKRNHRVWTKTVKYDVRKNFADSRLRVKGRFVKKEDELLMRELMSLT